MKKTFLKFITSVTIGVYALSANYSEARVTKEVAEAALPYLMEAAEVPRKQRTKEHRDAIISMIYTNVGQAEMVKWVKTGKFPKSLNMFPNQGTYKKNFYRKITLSTLFPCATDTFTSFANHPHRLGFNLLKKPSDVNSNLQDILGIKYQKDFNNILQRINMTSHSIPIEILIAKIIFILDICDSKEQLENMLGETLEEKVSTSEYMCRPVSAISTKKSSGSEREGDCVETLYRHLINIAIQDKDNFYTLHIDKIPSLLRKYYVQGNEISYDIKNLSEAGLTDFKKHDDWKKALRESLDDSDDISTGSIANIANILLKIAGIQEKTTTHCEAIQQALEKLSGKNKNFLVKEETVTEKPRWATKTITILETTEKYTREILIGIAEEAPQNNGHAEILSIMFKLK
ncbi:MAG: hypothetical protein IJ730_07345 [Alphaproteobacteria bacterium]|nr:hypothetical protein [Alphaproteobacteria bacterium]